MRTLSKGIPSPDDTGQNERLHTHRLQIAETSDGKRQLTRFDLRSFFFF